MVEKNVGQRLAVIGIVVLLAVIFLTQGLRPGQDIAGGTSLIFEIDTTGAEKDTGLAERVKTLLAKRVDPSGVYDLTWRVHGRNRIEVQMPLPPKDAKDREQAYRTALHELYELEIRRGPIEAALRMPPEARVQAIADLARRNADTALASLTEENRSSRTAAIEKGIAERERLLTEAAERYDALIAAREALARGPVDTQSASSPTSQPDTNPASAPSSNPVTIEELEDDVRDATELFEDAVSTLLATNLNRRRFEELLELEEKSDVRRRSLSQIVDTQADLGAELEEVIAHYGEWRDGKRYLDGPSDLKRLLRGTGKLEFRILAEPDPNNPTKYNRFRKALEEGRPDLPQESMGWFRVDNPMQFFNFDSPEQLAAFKPETHGRYVAGLFDEQYWILAHTSPNKGLLQDVKGQRKWRLNSARVDRDQHGRPSVDFTLDTVGGQMFESLTRRHLKQPLCILVDDIAYSAPNIQSAIRTRGQITGEFSADKVNYLVRSMEGGTLPARLKDTPLSERTVGSSLGETNRDSAVTAGFIGAIAVIVVMIGYYLFCGMIANVALALNVILVLAAMAMLNARITLVGIAGIILSVGMAVDANVLIYERIREEKARGQSLRMTIKNGYDKALSTIFDSNITTLLTCVIIYYVGSEEVKGFGLTLGWGIVLNLFTSIFVTRTLFGLALKYNLIKELKMMRIIGVPKIDWYAKRKFFIPMSAIVVVVGLSLLWGRGKDRVLDVEFLGGVTAEFEVTEDSTLNDKTIKERLEVTGTEIRNQAAQLENAVVEPIPNELNAFTLSVPGIHAERLAAMVAEPLEETNLLVRGGLTVDPEADRITLYVQGETSAEDLAGKVHGLVKSLTDHGENLQQATVNAVLEVGGIEQAQGQVWNLSTTVTNMRLVQHSLESALGDDMRTEPQIIYTFHGDIDGQPLPINTRLLDTVVPDLPPGINADLTNYLGGAALCFDQLDPPQTVQKITSRLENMHFQPDFEDMPTRDFEVIGVTAAVGPDGEALVQDGEPLYSKLVVVTSDPDIRYNDDPKQWLVSFAEPELGLAKTALENEQTLRKVMQFKPQIAARSTQQASLALLLSWGMIIGYLWIRFGRPTYGLAGVAALIHDALIALAFVGISGFLAGLSHWIPDALLITDFKINMTIIAALLTIIGYSINDTIVVFDRIRETRGRLGHVTPEIINASINQTLARTIMTSFTTLVVLTIMYIFGGGTIRGFNFCMIVGVLTGSYSSIAIASPLLMAHWGRRWMATPAKAT